MKVFQFLVRKTEENVLILCMRTLIRQPNLFYHQERQQLTWRRVCRKATDLSKLKENALGNTKKSSKRYKKFDNEVTMMSHKIRSCQFIKMSPQHSSDIISIDGQKLDSELCDFRYNANLHYKNYKKQLKAS